MISEYSEQVLISWLPEYKYCPRRFYLKVLEQENSINEYMAEGIADHQSIHKDRIEKRNQNIKVTGLTVYSTNYNLYGVCDCVEFIRSDKGAYIPMFDGKYLITPVEYKHGKIRDSKEYNMQLEAQALCLAEMYGCSIDQGFVYYTDSRRRFPVCFSKESQEELIKTIEEIKSFLYKKPIVEPDYMKRCQKCSMYDICTPKNRMTKKYMTKLWEKIGK